MRSIVSFFGRRRTSNPAEFARKRGRRAITEALENRLFLTAVTAGNIAAVTYTSNTSWTDTSQPYNLTGNVHVQTGATLTVGAGVTIVTSNGSSLLVSDDGTGATINATGAIFGAQLHTYTSTGGTIGSSTFSATPLFDGGASSSLALTGDTFNAGVGAQPEFVPKLAGNAFASNSTVYVLGNRNVAANTTWPLLSNVNQYQITYIDGNGGYQLPVSVVNGATLMIAAGNTVTTDSVGDRTLDVANDGSSAGIVANSVKFNVQVLLAQSATGSITNSNLLQQFAAHAPGGVGLAVTGDTFIQNALFDVPASAAQSLTLTGDTFNGGVSAHPEFVSKLAGNTFANNSTVYVLGNRNVTANTTWPLISNVNQYQISYIDGNGGYQLPVSVINGATLSIAAGNTVTTDSVGDRTLDVANDGSSAGIVANSVKFNVQVLLAQSATGSITNSNLLQQFAAHAPGGVGLTVTGDTFTQNALFDVPASAAQSLAITGDTFNGGVSAHPEFVPKLTGNTFAVGSTVYVLANRTVTANTTWPLISNVNQYQITYIDGNGGYQLPVSVINGATLMIAAGNTITTDSVSDRPLDVANDGGSAGIVANAVKFNVPVYLAASATGSIKNSNLLQPFQAHAPGGLGLAVTADTFTQNALFDVPASAAQSLTLTGDTFNGGVSAHPEFVPKLAGNGFAVNSTVYVLANRTVTANTTWPLISNVNQYEISYIDGNGGYQLPVSVVNGATLMIAAGNTVTTDSVSDRPLDVANDGSSAGIVANAVKFNAPVYLAASATGSITNSNLLQPFQAHAPGGSGLIVSGDTFTQNALFDVPASAAQSLTLTGDTFNGSVSSHPEFVPNLKGNTFATGSTVYVLANRTITANTTWPLIPNVNQYQITYIDGNGGYQLPVAVINGATLMIANGNTITTDNVGDRTLDVANDGSSARIIAAAVTFGTQVFLYSSAGGSIQYSTFNQALTISSGVTTTINNDTISSSVVTSGSTAQPVNLVNNWWGTTTASIIAQHINTTNGPAVIYQPFLLVNPTIPDLMPTTLTPSPGPWTAGQTISVSYTIANIAGAAQAPASGVSFVLQSVATGATRTLGLADVAAINAGASATGSAQLLLPAVGDPFWTANGLPGNYTIVMNVDATNIIVEQLKSNNSITSAPVTISAAPILASISGSLFNDVNGDGVSQAGDGPLAYWVTFIDTNKNGLLDAGEPVAVTNSAGTYSFTGLAAGTYRVTEILQGGYRASTGAVFSDVTVAAGASVAGPAFGDTTLAQVSGSVFGDTNADGVRESTETGLAGYRVYADLAGTGVYASTDPSVLTDASGNFALNLAAGTYKLRVVTPTGNRITTPAAGYSSQTVVAGTVASGLAFGDTTLAQLSGSVFNDANGDGVRQSTETGLAGYRVYADLAGTGVYTSSDPSVLTDANGNYALNLAAGTYKLRVVTATGHRVTTPVGGFFTKTTTAGSITTGLVFGDTVFAQISGSVFGDTNGDGVRQSTEKGLVGYRVYVDLKGTGVYATTDPSVLTDASGNFVLNLAAGTYKLRVVIASGHKITTPSVGYFTVTVGSGGVSTGKVFGVK